MTKSDAGNATLRLHNPLLCTTFAIGLLVSAHAHALGSATPTDIPGLIVLDANVPANDVNIKTVGADGNPPFQPGSTVHLVQITQPFIAIRAYYSPWENGKSGQAGQNSGWIRCGRIWWKKSGRCR
jgi:hypothetical protein